MNAIDHSAIHAQLIIVLGLLAASSALMTAVCSPVTTAIVEPRR